MSEFRLIKVCILLATLTVSLSVCPNGIYDNKVSNADIITIVNKHNNLRLMIAQGKVPNQPKGINLKKMSWDSKLAAEAQNIANSCEFKHVSVPDSRFYVGQNLYAWASTGYNKDGPQWTSAIDAWFNEYKNYKYSNSIGSAGHYTQIVWANTTLVGCGYSYFKTKENWHKKYYVCNYGAGGNVAGQTPYKMCTKPCGNPCKNLC